MRPPQSADPAELATRIATDAARAGSLLLCTDYDGTVAPIAPTPDEAHALPSALAALTALSAAGSTEGRGMRVRVQLAAITSRSAADLAGRLHLGPDAIIVGSAGLERWHRGRVELAPEVIPWLPAIAAAACRVSARLAEGRVPGARLECKPCGVVIHTRGLHSTVVEDAAVILAAEEAAVDGLRVLPGKRAVELRPPVDRDKGTALADLRRGVFATAAVCAAGDDLPDIPMLEVAARAPHGRGIAVADVEVPSAVLAAATDVVDGPWAWAETLQALVQRLASPGVVPGARTGRPV